MAKVSVSGVRTVGETNASREYDSSIIYINHKQVDVGNLLDKHIDALNERYRERSLKAFNEEIYGRNSEQADGVKVSSPIEIKFEDRGAIPEEAFRKDRDGNYRPLIIELGFDHVDKQTGEPVFGPRTGSKRIWEWIQQCIKRISILS